MYKVDFQTLAKRSIFDHFESNILSFSKIKKHTELVCMKSNWQLCRKAIGKTLFWPESSPGALRNTCQQPNTYSPDFSPYISHSSSWENFLVSG